MNKENSIPALSLEKLYSKQNDFYKNSYDIKETPWSSDGIPDPILAKRIQKIVGNIKPKTTLDLGCGKGRHSAFMLSSGLKVIGIEYQKSALESAQQLGNKRLLYLNGDIFRYPFKKSCFGLVLDYGVFHHIRRKDTEAYLDFLTKMIAPKGYYILSCFGRNFVHGDGKKYKRGFVLHKNHYDRFSSRKEIKTVFGEKFKIIEFNEDRKGILHLLMQSRW